MSLLAYVRFKVHGMADLRIFDRSTGHGGENASSGRAIFGQTQTPEELQPPSKTAARGALGLAVACFLFAFLLGTLAARYPASVPLLMPLGIACDWLAFAF